MVSVGVLLSTARFIAECLLSYQLVFVILVPMIPLLQLLGLFYILKIAERVIVKKVFGERHLPGMDSMWVSDDSQQQYVLSSVFCFELDGRVEDRIKLLSQAILERLVNGKTANGDLIYYRTRCYIRPGWFQYFLREDPSFNVENHVLKWEGEVPRSKDELMALVSRLSMEPLPAKRSPWRCTCIPTNFGKNDLFVLLRLSHALADGVSNVKFLLYQFPDKVIPQKEPQKFSTTNRLLFLVKAAFVTPKYLFELVLAPPDRSILHGPNLSGVKKIAWNEAFDLQLIKKIKSATGTTVNDVIMACLTSAMRKYFQKKGVENPVDVTASVPVDVRPPSKELHFDNYFSFIFPKMAVATDGILEQLYETRARMNEIKVSGTPFITAGIISISQGIFPQFLNTYSNKVLCDKTSCLFSNLPGPQQMYTVKGSRLKYLMFFPPHNHNIGVAMSVFSYAGQVIIGVHSDSAVLPDPEIIVEEFGNAINEMAKCVNGKNDSD